MNNPEAKVTTVVATAKSRSGIKALRPKRRTRRHFVAIVESFMPVAGEVESGSRKNDATPM